MPAHTITPPPSWGTRWHQQTACPHEAICLVQLKPGFIREEHTSPAYQWPSKVNICPLISVTMSSCSQVKTLVCKPPVSSAVRVAGHRQSRMWRSRMWRSWAGVVKCGLLLWARLDILPNSLKRHWRRLMVVKWTFSYLATALVANPAVSMPIARSLKTWDICGIMLCDITAHFRLTFYCPQHKVHLCNGHAV